MYQSCKSLLKKLFDLLDKKEKVLKSSVKVKKPEENKNKVNKKCQLNNILNQKLESQLRLNLARRKTQNLERLKKNTLFSRD